MCRLILAHGTFLARDILSAALAMSQGLTATGEGPTRCHPNGWGAVWRDLESGRLVTHRDERTICQDALPRGLDTDTLAVHVRHATLARTRGREFTHPLNRGDAWQFMHNGFLPTVYRQLGLPASRFDSAEYFDYIVPRGSSSLDPGRTLRRLETLEPGGSSGNAIAMNASHAYVIHWTFADNAYPRYFTMHRYSTPSLVVVSSEIIPELAPPGQWEPLAPQSVIEIPISPIQKGTDADAHHHDRLGPRHGNRRRAAA